MRMHHHFRACLFGLVFLLGAQVSTAQSIDLRSYFPDRINHFRWADGTPTHFYAFYRMPISRSNWAGTLYLDYFNQNLPGSSLLIWQKTYSGCTVTYAFLLLGGGADKRVQEVGDWFDTAAEQGSCNGAFNVAGYKTFPTHINRNGTPTGLNWSTSGGLDTSWSQFNLARVYRGISPYKYSTVDAYAAPGLVEILPTWRPKYGRDENGNWVRNPNKIYTNVARIRFYHGTTQMPRTCTGLDPSNPYSAFYWHSQNHASMAIEYYLDQEFGMLQETFLYAEHPQSGRPACDSLYPSLASSANLTQALARHEYYIDN